MDPDETLQILRKLARKIEDAEADSATVRAELGAALGQYFEALDGWLSSGGFLPKDWQRPAPTTKAPLPDQGMWHHGWGG